MSQKISIIVTYLPVNDTGVRDITRECLRRIRENTYNDFELILVVNGEDDEFTGDITLTNNKNYGNATAWDQGIWLSSTDNIVLMDNDVWVEKDWDVEMIERLSDKSIGITFPYSILGDEIKTNPNNHKGRRGGYCFAFKRDTYDKAGPFLKDQPFKLGYYEDDAFEYEVQYNLRLKLYACSSSKVWHKGQATAKTIWSKEMEDGIKANKAWYESKYGEKYPYIG